MNIAERIFTENADNKGVALVEGELTVTYPQLIEEALLLAGQLRSLGIRRGDCIAVMYPGGSAYIRLNLALLTAGAVVMPVPESSGDDEAADIIRSIGVLALISEKPYAAPGCAPVSRTQLASGAAVTFFKDDPGQRRECLGRSGAAFIRFSSGTTGKSKGVLLTHAAIEERTDAADEALAIRRDDRIFWVLPMSFHFVVSILLFLRRGAAIVICEKEFPASLTDAAGKNLPTFIYASPFHYAVLSRPGLLSPRAMGRVRLALSTAMSLPEETARLFHRAFGIFPAQAYGIIEAGLVCVNTGVDEKNLLSVGNVLPAYRLDIRERDNTGCGRVFIRGKGFFSAYLEPETPAEQVMADGWFDTGDLGRLDSRGDLYITGRAKNVINFCGMKIFPEEVEEVLNRYPGITGSIVYGMKHPDYGELVGARIAAGSEDIDLRALRAFCYRRLASYKVPKEIAVVEGIERTASGKIKRCA
ncbi:MAG: acyl--CoA ligase [Candidatus Omnitrophica bacterium]|nr:acyl--CoA ligase [Candidatus Omnitrophota bacterium]